jgi:hypothetical protein
MNDPTDDILCLQDCDETVADFYRLDRPKAPWGDYGDILIHGTTNCFTQDATSPELQRTGPFVPPIFFPGVACIVVTDTVRRELQSSGLTGFSFVPAIKSIIVPIDWHEWDLFSDEPAFYPEGGEPESYISEDAHSQELARKIPDLWRLVLAAGATEIRVPEGSHYDANRQIFIRATSWQGADFFRADTTLYNYISFRARQWLLERYPAWLACKPVQTK